MSRRKRLLFSAAAVVLPFVALAVAELVLRATWPSGALPLFVPAVVDRGDMLASNPRVSRRWFTDEGSTPVPPSDPFYTTKPARAFRVFVLGESTTAGFPYPHNGTFSRVLRDELRDVLPFDSVEVVNLGIAATNSYAMLDMVDEVLARSPDAVMIYGGHNEYYGALGASSTEGGLGGAPSLVRLYLRLQRLRLVMALRQALTGARRAFGSGARGQGGVGAPASFMETLARDAAIPVGSGAYRRGASQFEDNLTHLLRTLSAARVPTFIASLTSNLRDQLPFAAPANGVVGGADSVYSEAGRALARGDTIGARRLFARARDLDVVRFRAPSEFNEIIRRVAVATGAAYVPVAERFEAQAPANIPGSDLFLEHVHPNAHGQAIIARAFFEAIRDQRFLGHEAHVDRLRSWEEYERRMELTPLDLRVATHTVRTIGSRWPFVSASEQRDYRGTYRPTDLLDSLAFGVSAGAPWAQAKVRMGRDYQRRSQLDSAVAEYRGLVRDAPFFATPWELLGGALMDAHQDDEARATLQRSLAIRPSADAAFTAGLLALRHHDLPGSIALMRQSLSLAPDQPQVLYQLSLAYGSSRDLQNARATALRLWRIAPNYPGLAEWMRLLGAGS
jgi:lysophospholipase L1-like esterase